MVFDRYFDKSLKNRTRLSRGEGSQYSFEGDNTEIPFRMADNFLKNSCNKNKLNEYLARKLIELHQGHQVFVVTFKDTALSVPSLCEELDQCLPVRPSQLEKADQRLVRLDTYH